MLKKFNDMEGQIYYSLIDLSMSTDLKYRQLINRVKEVSQDISDSSLIYKEKNRWYISNNITNLFKRKRAKTNIDYKYFVTIASKNYFDEGYWTHIVKTIHQTLKEKYSKTIINYVIEYPIPFINLNLPHNRHLHFYTNFNDKKMLRGFLDNYELTNRTNDMNVYIIDIYYLEGLIEYLNKQFKLKQLR